MKFIQAAAVSRKAVRSERFRARADPGITTMRALAGLAQMRARTVPSIAPAPVCCPVFRVKPSAAFGKRMMPNRKRVPRRLSTILPSVRCAGSSASSAISLVAGAGWPLKAAPSGKDTHRAIFGERASRKLSKGLCWHALSLRGARALMTASRNEGSLASG